MSGASTTPDRVDPVCPTAEFPVQIGGKWTGMIVVCLSDGPRRFTELRRMVGEITPKVLTQTLRDMERDGMVTRVSYPENPPRVEYELTGLGVSLLELIDSVRSWSAEHLGALLEARRSARAIDQ